MTKLRDFDADERVRRAWLLRKMADDLFAQAAKARFERDHPEAMKARMAAP